MRYFILPLIACAATATAAPLPEKVLEGFAGLALECVHREYPNKIAHVMGTDADAQPPPKTVRSIAAARTAASPADNAGR